jgi:hypothetical protein
MPQGSAATQTVGTMAACPSFFVILFPHINKLTKEDE